MWAQGFVWFSEEFGVVFLLNRNQQEGLLA
jgi:hypothetical protein